MRISSAVVTSFAPFSISFNGATEREEVIGPGTANTGRLILNASSAVIILPLSAAPSVTKTPKENPAIIRFRRGNEPIVGVSFKGNSEIITPEPATILSYNGLFTGGKHKSTPLPRTAIVFQSA